MTHMNVIWAVSTLGSQTEFSMWRVQAVIFWFTRRCCDSPVQCLKDFTTVMIKLFGNIHFGWGYCMKSAPVKLYMVAYMDDKVLKVWSFIEKLSSW
jgi:hypothetical protein